MKEFGKEQWVGIFKEISLTEEQMHQFHVLFEANYPEKHQEFLEWLGIDASEIQKIRQFA